MSAPNPFEKAKMFAIAIVVMVGCYFVAAFSGIEPWPLFESVLKAIMN